MITKIVVKEIRREKKEHPSTKGKGSKATSREKMTEKMRIKQIWKKF